MPSIIPQRVEAARAGLNPTVICQVPSGWVVACDQQYLWGYCILVADPLVGDLNALNELERAQFLKDMAAVGDALLAVTGSSRINYAVMGNSDPYLHAHIVPRYADEPEPYRFNTPWSYPPEHLNSRNLDLERDRSWMEQVQALLEER